ncbi:MAG: glycosyltransferase family 1 protein [bacterium]
MKRIGIDARLINQTGVGVYIRNLLYCLAELDTPQFEFYIYTLQADIGLVPKHTKFTLRTTSARWHGFAEQTTFLFQLLRDGLDLMHFTYFSWPIAYFRPFVATVHDLTLMTHETGRLSTQHPLVYQLKRMVFRVVFSSQIVRARALMVPTKAIAKALKDRFGRDAEAVHEGINRELLFALPEATEALQNESFLLYVGNCYPHKNIQKLLDAAHGMKLVMVGPQNSFSEGYQKLHPEVTWFFHLSNARLRWLYEHAQALVNPSLAEGFGLPVVEALAFGCPVVCSDIPVFHEVTEEKATFFDPTSVEDIRSKLLQVIKRIPTTPAPFVGTFKAMAAKTLHIYQLALAVR